MSITLGSNAYSNFSVKSTPASTPASTSFKSTVFENFPVDTFEFCQPEKVQIYPPKISMARVLFHRLKKEQIEAVNTSGELPKNAKFVDGEKLPCVLIENKIDLVDLNENESRLKLLSYNAMALLYKG